MRLFEVMKFFGLREEDILASSHSVVDCVIEDEDTAVEEDGSCSEERQHILLVEGKFMVAMWESNKNGLSVSVPSCRPFVCIFDDSFRFGRIGHVSESQRAIPLDIS